MSTSRSGGSSAAAFALGVVVGIVLAAGVFLFVHRDTVVFEAKETMTAEGIVIPKGTHLIHDTEMSEGFDRLALYLNVDPVTLGRSFTRRVDSRGLLRTPYWVDGPRPDATQPLQTNPPAGTGG